MKHQAISAQCRYSNLVLSVFQPFRNRLEEEMATHSSILAWEIPWTEEEPGGLQSMGL